MKCTGFSFNSLQKQRVNTHRGNFGVFSTSHFPGQKDMKHWRWTYAQVSTLLMIKSQQIESAIHTKYIKKISGHENEAIICIGCQLRASSCGDENHLGGKKKRSRSSSSPQLQPTGFSVYPGQPLSSWYGRNRYIEICFHLISISSEWSDCSEWAFTGSHMHTPSNLCVPFDPYKAFAKSTCASLSYTSWISDYKLHVICDCVTEWEHNHILTPWTHHTE